MAHLRNYLAFDLGAESGRAILGQFDGKRLQLRDAHRFPNGPVRLPDGMHWDVLRLWSEIKQGITLARQQCEGQLASVGVDTWGVDFGLFDAAGALIGNPHHYRDSRTDGILQEAFRRVPRAEVFARSGIQFMELNTVFQLLSMVISCAPALDIAKRLLNTPDIFNYWLTGRMAHEFTIATTTQCYDPRASTWSEPLLKGMGIPTHIFGDIVPSGTVLGPLLPAVANEVGAQGVSVIAPACHDTGSAVAAVPAEGPVFAWISSGTWSIVGAEIKEPVINAQSLAYNFTNEGGAEHTFRFCKNITGLWIVQESRRTWAAQGENHSYAELTQMAAEAEPFLAVIDCDCAEFLKPGDMPSRIRAFCQRTGQRMPETKGAIIRIILEAIALKYRRVLEWAEELLGHRLEPLHIVGGGTQNRLLSQFAADATGRPVITGPIEATAIGNLLVQAIALGDLASVAEARGIIRDSFELAHFEPNGAPGWDEAYARLLAIMQSAF